MSLTRYQFLPKYRSGVGFLILGFLLSYLTVSLSRPVTPSVEVIVDSTQQYQVIQGFGATHLSLTYEGIGDTLSPKLRERSIDAVYNQVGISMGNLEAALLESPSEWDARANDNNDPLSFNWNGFRTWTAEAMKQKVVDPAVVFGFNNYYLSQSIRVHRVSPWLDDIRKVDYEKYLDEAAEQFAAGNLYWRDKYRIIPNYQMLFNEPLSGNRELLNGTVHDVVDIIKKAGNRLRSEGFKNVNFVVPNEETVADTLRVAQAILADSEARQFVGAIGYHSYPYGSTYASISKILSTSGMGKPDSDQITIRQQLRDLGRHYRIPVWMTEVSHGEVDPRSFEDFRGRAIHIHDELVYADAAAYFGMNNMWDRRSHQQHFANDDLFSEEGTIVLIDNDAETVDITGMGYAIGHYSRWIKPEAVRLEATSSDALVQVSAFRDDAQKRIVLVAINNAAERQQLKVQVEGLRLKGSVTGERSTSSAYWQPFTPIRLNSSTQFTLEMPAESVVTVISQIS